MKRTRKQIGSLFLAVCMVLMALSGCGGKDAGDFTSKATGVWQRNGNLQDDRLEVLDDGTWTNKELKDGTWEIADQGVISYDKEYKTFNFENDNKFYPVEYSSSSGEVLHYKNDNFYRAENSMDGFSAFDGKWCPNADMDGDYYSFENGEWKWFKAQGMSHVSVDNGNLAWDGAAEKLLAYAYADGEVFAAFVPSDTGELMLDDVPYVFMENGSAAGDSSSDIGKTTNSELPIRIEEFYYLDGERGQPSFYFYADGKVDYDDGYGGAAIEAVYSINDDEIVIKISGDTMLGTLGIVDSSILLDAGGEDIYAISTD